MSVSGANTDSLIPHRIAKVSAIARSVETDTIAAIFSRGTNLLRGMGAENSTGRAESGERLSFAHAPVRRLSPRGEPPEREDGVVEIRFRIRGIHGREDRARERKRDLHDRTGLGSLAPAENGSRDAQEPRSRRSHDRPVDRRLAGIAALESLRGVPAG